MKKHLGKLVAFIAIALCVWMVFKTFQDNSAKYDAYEKSIDSLTKINAALDSVHVKQDSTIVVYQDSIVYLDHVIESEKVKYVKIKKEFEKAKENITIYTPAQTDSFLKARYNY
jgi:hypothetical protein